MLTPSATIGLIGFGEAGGLLGQALARRGCAVRAWDILLDDPQARPRMLARMEAAGVDPACSLAGCLRGSKLVICAVTAGSAGDVADAAGSLLQAGQVFLDIDSAAPTLNALGFATVAEPAPSTRPLRGELP